MKPPLIGWHVPSMNERRAGLRYRCLYPMAELSRQGVAAERFQVERSAHYTHLVLDAWNLFPSVSDADQVRQLLELVQTQRRLGTRIVVDNCDNQFANIPDTAWALACEQLRSLARSADTVLCCSQELAGVMQRQCGLAQTPTVVEDPIETEIRYASDRWWRSLLSPGRKRSWWRHLTHRRRLAAERAAGITPLVWFGAHGNQFAEGGMLDLLRVVPVLQQLAQGHRLSLTVISNHAGKFEQHFSRLGFPSHYLEWDRVTFLDSLRLHEIALLPMSMNDFTRCKSANRMALSLYHGLNVVADPLPAYRRFAGCSQQDDWLGGLQAYLQDAALRRSHRQSGRDLAWQAFSPARIAQQWRQALQLPEPS